MLPHSTFPSGFFHAQFSIYFNEETKDEEERIKDDWTRYRIAIFYDVLVYSLDYNDKKREINLP